MTPYEFAKRECANLRPDGSCLEILPEGLTNTALPAVPHERCLLKQKPLRRCRYFEKCVLPQADRPGPKDRPGLQLEKQEARRRYWQALGPDHAFHIETPAAIRRCPDCGGPLAVRQRYCLKCSRRRRLESNRKAIKKKRQTRMMSVSS